MQPLYRWREFDTLARGDRPHGDRARAAPDSLARTVSTLLRPSGAAVGAATYVHGVFSDSERKSMQAMLARVTQPVTYQAFQHFITHAVWDATGSGGASSRCCPSAAAC